MILDLSWNNIGEAGAIEFATAMLSNKELVKLNLAANGLNDRGAQRFVDSLASHPNIAEVNLAQSGITDGTCFVISQVRSPCLLFSSLLLTSTSPPRSSRR